MMSLRNSVVSLVDTRKSGGGTFGVRSFPALSIKSALDCFPCHGRLVGLTSSRCLSFNRLLGYLQMVSGPQICVRVGEGFNIILSQKKKKKVGNNFCVLELKPLTLNNYYCTQLVPFPKYCHICVQKIL